MTWLSGQVTLGGRRHPAPSSDPPVISHNVYYVKLQNLMKNTTKRRPVRRWYVSPADFLELRHSCALSRKACAAYLGVSLHTVRHWETGRHRVPWSTVRLLRLLRCGDLGAYRA
jgi:DNA-binding transcriptional regulator YiaG